MSDNQVIYAMKNNIHLHHCPGCKENHIIPDGWDFNNDMLKPTFSPSIKHDWGNYGPKGNKHRRICHYFIRDGKIEFCSDSTHELAGKTIDLEIFKKPNWLE